MARAADSPATSGTIERGRGGFYRRADDVPYVSDPAGELVKSGPRKGQVKRLIYGSPSNRGKQIENTTNLVKWGERRVALGLGATLLDAIDNDQAADVLDDMRKLTTLDVDCDEYKTLADSVIIRAKDAAEANLAAQRGTYGHAITEDHDEGRDIVARAEAGELLGIDAALQRRIFIEWGAMLAANGLEILATEASCVDDAWRLAGTLDRVARLTRDLRFTLLTGEVVVVPAGTVVVLDVKTGKLRFDREGSVMYWHGYSIQIASYAQSRPYDTEAETRGQWPWPIDQDHALIAHLDLAALIGGGEAGWRLVYVDLVAGREHGGACVVMAKAWEQRSDVFSVAQLDEIAAAGAPPPCAPAAVEPGAGGSPADSGPAALPSSSGPGTPREQIDRLATRRPVDEGVEAADEFEPIKARYDCLDGVGRAWIGALTEQAMQARMSFHAGETKSLRRLHIIDGLVTLAEAEAYNDLLLRGVLELEVGSVAQFPAVTPGAVVGSLDVHEAARFADYCRRFVANAYQLALTEDDTISLEPAKEAA